MKQAKTLLARIKQYLIDHEIDIDCLTISEVVQKKNGTNSNEYHKALKHATKTSTIFLKRNCAETCINNYNSQILKCWRANIDLQYVTSPYAAIAYITSYITKDEREVGTVLQAVSRELRSQNK